MQQQTARADSPGVMHLWRRGVLLGIARLHADGWHIETWTRQHPQICITRP